MSYNFDYDEPKYYLGLDFGTSKCFMSYKVEGEREHNIIEITSIQNSSRGIPSEFYVDENGNESVCNQITDEMKVNHPDGLVQSIKMLLDKDEITVRGRRYETYYIAKKIIEKVIELSREQLKEEFIEEVENKIVVGVPVTFGSVPRKKIKDIINELNYGCELVNEPALASLYYSKATRMKHDIVLSLDFGAGTFDVSLLKKNNYRSVNNPEPFITIAQDGNNKSGDECDRLLAKVLVDKIRQKPGTIDVSKFEDETSIEYRQLMLETRNIKEKLSGVEESEFGIMIGNKGATTISVTRREFEDAIVDKIIEPAIDKAMEIVNRNNLYRKNFSIILIGGTSRIPLVERKVKERFNWIDSSQIGLKNPEKSVALGASLFAEEPAFIRKINLGYAIQTHDEKDKAVLDVCIPSDVDLPYRYQAEYRTMREGQTGVTLNLFEVPNCSVGEYIELEKGVYTNFSIRHDFGKPVPRGTPIIFEIEISGDGIINAKIIDRTITNSDSSKSLNVGIYR